MSSNISERQYSSTREFLSLGALRAMGVHSSISDKSQEDKGLVSSARTEKSKKVVNIMRSVLKKIYSAPFSCACTSSKKKMDFQEGGGGKELGNRVTGTLFGYRRGRAQFAVQENPQSNPVLLVELAILTNTLVKEMAAGLVKIALECERGRDIRLFEEPNWTMYCNGRKAGNVLRRNWSQTDLKVLKMVHPVSMGAGVLPMEDEEKGSDGELMFMRASFHRVVGSSDSEALHMMNPHGTGEPELSIFFLRI